ncbi:MAG TPA: 3-isopropylmalate dehydratase small subunit [Thermoplasmata archaeon]|nr:3-isopropylmalate dehydratase small subunit [Thermoplasmata archaeon]
MKNKMKGRAWRFKDNVDTDQVIPAEYLITGDPKELSKHVFEKVRPDFAGSVKVGDMIVGGKNFGCGSSREHAVRALMGAGISCVIAESFARIFYRNSINLCLPPVECTMEVKNGDLLDVDLVEGRIQNLTDGRLYSFRQFPSFAILIMQRGGLMRYVEDSCTE